MTDNVEALQRHLDSAKSVRQWLISERDALADNRNTAQRALIRSEIAKVHDVVERIERALKKTQQQAADEASLTELAKAVAFARHSGNSTTFTAEQLWVDLTQRQRDTWVRVAKTARDLVAGGVPQPISIAFDGNPIELSRLGHVGRIVIDRDNQLTGHIDPDRRIAELGTAAVKALEQWPLLKGAQPW